MAEYNQAKSQADIQKAFDDLTEFLQGLSHEEARYLRENAAYQEVLAVFDLLKEGKILDKKELQKIKEVAAKTLTTLKAEKLKSEQ